MNQKQILKIVQRSWIDQTMKIDVLVFALTTKTDTSLMRCSWALGRGRIEDYVGSMDGRRADGEMDG